jgi:hypothetical protein
MSGPINYHGPGIADYTHNVIALAQELESIGEEAKNLVAGLSEHYDTIQGSGSHAERQAHVMQGINEGREVFIRHMNTVDTATSEFVGFDHTASNTFQSI